MCGLVYIKSFTGEPVGKKIKDRYTEQKHRGQEGFGLYLPESNFIYRHTEEAPILNQLSLEGITEGLFHHRMPTSTDNTATAAHPFTTRNFFKTRNFVLAHNGIITGTNILYEKHKAMGIKYQSLQTDGRFNDSECLLWEFALIRMGRQEEMETHGGAAFIAIESEIVKGSKGLVKPLKLHFARNRSNPLVLTMTKEQLTLASTGTWDRDSVDIMTDFLYTYDYETKVLSLQPFKVPVYVYTPPTSTSHDYHGKDYSGWKPKSKQAALPAETKHYERPKLPTLTAGDIDDKATKLISDLFARYDTIDQINNQLVVDIKRAQQAVAQLSHKTVMKPKSANKYIKYYVYLQTCIRALKKLEMLYDFAPEV